MDLPDHLLLSYSYGDLTYIPKRKPSCGWLYSMVSLVYCYYQRQHKKLSLVDNHNQLQIVYLPCTENPSTLLQESSLSLKLQTALSKSPVLLSPNRFHSASCPLN